MLGLALDDAKRHRTRSGMTGCVVSPVIQKWTKTKKAPSDSVNLTGLWISNTLFSL